MADYIVAVDEQVTPDELAFVRQDMELNRELWQTCIEQALCVISARQAESRKLVGVIFLLGNLRHGLMADMSVHPDHRAGKLGTRLFDATVDRARELGIRYLQLTYDTKTPWLKDFYQRHGFEGIDFAMWHKDSLAGL